MIYFILKLFEWLFRCISWVFLAMVGLTVLGFIAPSIKNIHQFAYLQYLLTFDHTVNLWVKDYVPTQIGDTDISRIIVLVANFMLLSFCGSIEYRFNYQAEIRKLAAETKKLEKLGDSQLGAKKLAVLDEKMQAMQSADHKDRAILMDEFVAIKQQLENMRCRLAFLSVDIVDSTGMKVGEDPILVTRDFMAYRKFAEDKLNYHGCIKSTWTPDGIMAAFKTEKEAIAAAQSMINGLKEFNQIKKAMKKDFVIRCGINAGELLFDDTVPLEQISDHVIDIAGHMQKYADPSSIFLPKTLVEAMASIDSFKPCEKVVDELAVCMWRPS